MKSVLYPKFLSDKKNYNLNQGYWTKKINRLEVLDSSLEKLFKNADAKGSKLYDANPIYTGLDTKSKRAVRIIQEDPVEFADLKSMENISEHGMTVQEPRPSYPKMKTIDAWLDTITVQNTKVDELVISLLLTPENGKTALKLIEAWYAMRLTDQQIDGILNAGNAGMI